MKNLTWDEVQEQSDNILSCGLHKLKNRPFGDATTVTEKGYGNYLISLDKTPYYIGEGKELVKRLKQQFKPNTSTFYKTFQAQASSNQLINPNIPIESFEIQYMPTFVGRKEVEEFGIVNLATRLNKFQKGKRSQCTIADHNGLWDMVQQNAMNLLKEGEEKILSQEFTPWFDVKVNVFDGEPEAGLYLVQDDSGNLIYVGESSNVGARILTHSGQTYFSALRRHIGTDILKYTLQTRNNKKRYFDTSEDNEITAFLGSCKATVLPVSFGRYELEEYLIRKYKPLLNRKGNKQL